MEKFEREGQVAVLISPGFGAGWSTWSDDYKRDILLMDRRFVQAALDGVEDISPIVDEVFGSDSYVYTGGWSDITVIWLAKGTAFTIEEYDGSESLRTFESLGSVA